MDSPVLLNEYRLLEYSYPNDNFRHWALLFLQVSRRLEYQIEYIPFNSNCLSITIKGYPSLLEYFMKITSIMESRISGKHQQLSGLLSPPNLILTNNCLHDGIKATFWSIQVARHLSPFDFSLCSIRMES